MSSSVAENAQKIPLNMRRCVCAGAYAYVRMHVSVCAGATFDWGPQDNPEGGGGVGGSPGMTGQERGGLKQRCQRAGDPLAHACMHACGRERVQTGACVHVCAGATVVVGGW